MLIFALSVAFADPVYVQASLLNAREAPLPDAPVAAWLRIGTAVEVSEERGEWVRVRVASRPVQHTVEGWVLGRFLEGKRPTEATIRASVDPKAQTERLAALGADGDPKAPIHMAMCADGRAEYAGFWGLDGDFVDRSTWQASPPELMDLSALHWTELGRDGSSKPIRGSPFVRPFRTERWNEVDPSPYVPGTCADMCDGDGHVILGPCKTDGSVFTSRKTGTVPAGTGLVREAVEWTQHEEPNVSWSTLDWVMEQDGWTARVSLVEDEPGSPRQEGLEMPRIYLHIPKAGMVGVAPFIRPTTRGWVVVQINQNGFRQHRLYMQGSGC